MRHLLRHPARSDGPPGDRFRSAGVHDRPERESPKKADVINRIGARLARKHGLAFLEADFKKKGGFQKSIELSRRYGLYRQNYCGCLYSRKDGPP
jgi:hypothetical protein